MGGAAAAVGTMIDSASFGGLSQTHNSKKLRGIIKLRNEKARLAVSNNNQSSIELNSSIGKANDRGGAGAGHVAKLVNTLNPKLLNQGLSRVASISRGNTSAGIADIMPRTAESPTRLAPR